LILAGSLCRQFAVATTAVWLGAGGGLSEPVTSARLAALAAQPVAAVPEPSSVVILVLGAIGLASVAAGRPEMPVTF